MALVGPNRLAIGTEGKALFVTVSHDDRQFCGTDGKIIRRRCRQ